MVALSYLALVVLVALESVILSHALSQVGELRRRRP